MSAPETRTQTRQGRWRALLFGVVCALGLAAAVELACWRINVHRRAQFTLEDGFTGNVLFDWQIAYKPKPSRAVRARKTFRGAPIYDVVYTIDEACRRLVPFASPVPQDRFILFFGDSFAFGEGLNDDETLPYYAAREAPACRMYNYAFSGYGPQQMLAHLERETLRDEIGPREGIALFVFIPGHVRRAIGSMRTTTEWARHFPYYTEGSAGLLERHGTFHEARPRLTAFYGLLARSQTLRLLDFDLPPRVTAAHLARTADILEASAARFHEKFGGGTFYVVLYPDAPNNEFPPARIIPYLEARAVPYLNYEDLLDDGAGTYWMAHDGHPTAAANQRVARRLIKDLGL